MERGKVREAEEVRVPRDHSLRYFCFKSLRGSQKGDGLEISMELMVPIQTLHDNDKTK